MSSTERTRLARPAEVLPAPMVDAEEVYAAYLHERDVTVRQRLDLMVGLWLAGLVIVVVFEHVSLPQLAWTALHFHGVDAGVQLVALALAHFAGRWVSARAVATVLLMFLLVRASWFAVEIHANPELLAVTHITVLGGLAVLVPWGWVPQALVVTTSLASYALTVPALPAAHFPFYILATFGSGALTTILGAHLIERYRREAFTRARCEGEDAEIATRLVRITETLTTHLAAPDLLERVCEAAVEALDADWSAAWVLDDEGRIYRPGALVDTNADSPMDTAILAIRADRLAVVRELTPGTVLALASPSDPHLNGCRLPPRLAISSALLTAIVWRGQPGGVLVHGWRRRTGPFPARQRRLAAGIAHAAAVALENARLIADLQAADRLKSEFVSKMSHEFRTPLNVVGGYADLLLDGTFGMLSPQQRETVVRMRRSALSLLELVDSALDLGRIEAGREVVRLAPLGLSELFAEVDAELETLIAPAVSLRWRTEVAGPVVTDRLKLKTIVKNLVGNALKFTQEGTVEVRARLAADGGLVLTVRDTGIGIAAADLPLIFEMFRQVDGSATRRFGGVGLGLHIVARLVDLLRGTVEVESTLGEGSTFTVRLAAATVVPVQAVAS
jgi:signal transduction histidine kinase